MLDRLHAHTLIVADELVEGRVTPFLGAGVNRFARLAGDAQPSRSTELPDGHELASHLATRFHFSFPEGETPELLRIAQWVTVMLGSLPLYRELHEIFSSHYVPNPLHAFFATFPARLARAASRGAGTGTECPPQRRIRSSSRRTTTTCSSGRSTRRASRTTSSGTSRDGRDGASSCTRRRTARRSAIVDPTDVRRAVDLEERTVILKIHGAVDRDDAERRQLRHHRGQLHRLPDADATSRS